MGISHQLFFLINYIGPSKNKNIIKIKNKQKEKRQKGKIYFSKGFVKSTSFQNPIAFAELINFSLRKKGKNF